MLIDMHLHEKVCSLDSFLSINEIVSKAKKRGLDAVVITDHDNMMFREEAEFFAKEQNFPIFVGVELLTEWGDITAWALKLHEIDFRKYYKKSTNEFLKVVDDLGGFTISCHPYRNNNRGLGDNIRNAQLLKGVEALNGSTSAEANKKAYDISRECDLKMFGASDAHINENIAKYVTYLPYRVTNLADFIAELREAKPFQIYPCFWNGKEYIKYEGQNVEKP